MKCQIRNILKYDLCLGCGLCQSVSSGRVQMRLNSKGFYEPNVSSLKDDDESLITQVCPGINVTCGQISSKSIWGTTLKAVNAWSTDSIIRHTASSGGVTTALAIYLLESKKVDGILQVGVEEGNYLHNKLYLNKRKEEVLKSSSSRYAPAPLFKEIINLLDYNPKDTFAFIGKPCDIAGIKNLIQEKPQYKSRIKYFLSIFCAGMPSYNATKQAIESFNREEEPIALRYRGDGWPGYFTATYSDGSKEKMTYNDSWGKILGRQLGFRCKICPDGIGMLADIASGDSWNTKNGYPDFAESEGKNFCFIRTSEGLNLFNDAEKAGYVTTEELNVEDVKSMQAYQYNRRHFVGWRILTTQLATKSILHFENLGYYRNALHSNIIKGIKQAVGTYRRLKK